MDAEETAANRRLGEVLGGKWALERLIGTGGMAAVFAARDRAGNPAAVKLLHPEVALREDVRERFLREAYVANQIEHPGAVRVLEHGGGGDDEPAYIVMELLQGRTLADRVKLGIGTAELLDVMEQVLGALAHAHARGFIHRDLKPDNIFLCDDGQVKILDFGLARLLDELPGSFRTRSGTAVGTVPYMPPEQALGRRDELDGRTDLFALGATAFRVASGRKLHDAESEAELLMAMASKPAPPLGRVAPAVPSDVCAIIDLALAFSKEWRYPDAATMRADVRDVRAGRRPSYAHLRASKRAEPTQVDMPAFTPPASARRGGGTLPFPAPPAPSSAPPAPSSTPPAPSSTPPAPTSAPSPPRSRTPLLIQGAIGLALLGGGVAYVSLTSAQSAAAGAPAGASVAAPSPRTAPGAPASAVSAGLAPSAGPAPSGSPSAGPGRAAGRAGKQPRFPHLTE